MDLDTDGLAVINVDQLSRDVHAIVQASVTVDPPFHDISHSVEQQPPPDFDTPSRPTPSLESLEHVYYNSSSLNSVTSSETTHILTNEQGGTQSAGLDASKIVQQLSKVVTSSHRNQHASVSTKRLHQRHHGSRYKTTHLRPILPATMAPGKRQGQRPGQPLLRSQPSVQTVESVESQLQAELDAISQGRLDQSDAASMSSAASSHSGINNFPPASIAMNTRPVSDGDDSSSSLQLTNHCQALAGLSSPGPLNVQVPSTNSVQHLQNPLGSYSAQNLLAQLALMSPGNSDTTGAGQSQAASLQSLLSPHSQSTLLPYLLRTMASLGQPGGNNMEMSLLTEPTAANDCSEETAPMVDLNSLPSSHRDLAYPNSQDMNSALFPTSAASQLPFHPNQTFQAVKSMQQAADLAAQAVDSATQAAHPATQTIDLAAHTIDLAAQEMDLAARGATSNISGRLPVDDVSQETSTLAPSIITSSIHSLCLPVPGVCAPAVNAASLATSGSNQLNISSSISVQNSTIQLNEVTELADQSVSGPRRSLDLQSLAMQISNIPSSTATHQQAIPSLEATNPGDEFWCVHCDETMPQVCPHHGPPTVINDTPILRRARMTLPSSLYLKKSGISKEFLGVWAKVVFRPGCQFGPMEGTIKKKLASDADNLSPYIWKVFQNSRVKHYLDLKNEDVSNWMMFVRRARKQEEQNVAAHQMKGKIYYTTKREIKPGEELMMWFNKDYAQMSGATLQPEDSFKCTLCGRQFSYRQELEGHILYRHPSTDRRRHSCRVCGKAFATSTKLNLHMLKHTGDRPHQCKICHKSFTDASNLKRHARIHSGEKQFQCTVCMMSFRQKAHLVTHSVVHTGEKKLKCQFCLKFFARKSDLTTHMHLHSHEKKHNCTFCSRTFARKEHLRNHITTHTKERNFACDLCGKTYRSKSHLWKHKVGCKKKHPSAGTAVALP